MRTTWAGGYLRLAVMTLRDPKASLRIILDIVITMSQLLQATALVVVLSMLLPMVTLLFQPTEPHNSLSAIALNPITAVVVQMVILIGVAGFISFFGRVFGGYGTFKEALTAMAWLQFVLIVIQVIQIALSILSAQFDMMVFFLSMMIMIYLTVNFVMEIHGFTNPMVVTFGVIGSFFGVALILSILLVLLGITPEVIQDV